MEQWSIGLSPWIIADGNYRDFQRWQLADFALEFHARFLSPTIEEKRLIRHVKDAHYRAVAQVVFCSNEAWVVDFGLCAYSTSATTSPVKEGDFVELDFYLGVDPFFYFERLHKLSGMPPLIYSWQVEKIIRQTAPLIERRAETGKAWLEPDASRYAYEEVEHTGGRRFRSEQEAFDFHRTTSLS